MAIVDLEAYQANMHSFYLSFCSLSQRNDLVLKQYFASDLDFRIPSGGGWRVNHTNPLYAKHVR